MCSLSRADRPGVAVNSCFMVLGSNLSRDTDYPEFFCGIPKSLEENIGLLSLLGRDHFQILSSLTVILLFDVCNMDTSCVVL